MGVSKDRLGQAVISFIFSLLAIVLFIIGFSFLNNINERLGYGDTVDYTPLGIFFCFCAAITLISFILGFRARKSLSGRGIAIASMTISSLIFIGFMALIIVASILMYNIFGESIQPKDETVSSQPAISNDNKIKTDNTQSENKDNSNKQDITGCDENQYILALGNMDMPLVKQCLLEGNNPNLSNHEGVTAVVSATLKNNAEIVELALSRGADPNVETGKTTPLISASQRGDLEIVNLLLKGGADPNLEAYSTSPLFIAVVQNHPDVVQTLLESGADPNYKNTEGETGLMFASIQGNLDMVKDLIAHGANVSAYDNHGDTAINYATNYPEIIKLMEDTLPVSDD